MKHSLQPFWNFAPLTWEENDWPEISAGQGLNIYKDDNKVVVEASVPGMETGDIDVSFEDGVLRINAKKEEKDEKSRAKRQVHRWERSTSFNYSTTLPWAINTKTIKAETKNGVLTVTADMAEEAKARKIEVKAGQ